jgi:hypothetical protein
MLHPQRRLSGYGTPLSSEGYAENRRLRKWSSTSTHYLLLHTTIFSELVAGVELFSFVRYLQFLLIDFGILPEDEQQNLLLFSDIVSGLVTYLGEVTSRRTVRASSSGELWLSRVS